MTLPNASKPLLMDIPSLIRSPMAAVRLSYKGVSIKKPARQVRALTRSEPARSTKWNFETTVTHSPLSSSILPLASWCPRELAGRSILVRPIADGILGVPGRPNVGEETRFPDGPARMEPGRARRDGDRPLRGRGEEDRCGGPEPLYFR
jgi:hypothetical protein